MKASLRVNPLVSGVFWLLSAHFGFGGTVEQVGGYSNWATTWQVLPGGNEIHNTGVTEELDFVGDLTNPWLYWSDTDE